MVDVAFSYAEQIFTQQGNWLTTYTVMIALNSTIEGPSSAVLNHRYQNMLDWLYTNVTHESERVRCSVACLFQ